MNLPTHKKSGMMLCSVTTLPSKILTKASLHYVIWLYMILKKNVELEKILFND